MPHRAGRNDLKPAQHAALAALSDGSAEQLTRGQYEQLTGASRSQAAYDLADLVEPGRIPGTSRVGPVLRPPTVLQTWSRPGSSGASAAAARRDTASHGARSPPS